MAVENRSLSDILQDTIRNVQEIVRSEVRLAKTEIREEVTKAKASTLLIAVGAVTAVFAVLFLLFTAVYALALVMPNWAAALIVGAVLAVTASVMITTGLKRFKQIHPTPERTVETIKENVEWVKQQAK
jgi:uncharacterized membrane protein YqjE